MSEIINGANMNRSGAYPGWQAISAIDEAAAAAKTEVTVTQVQTSTNGTKIATIGVDDVNTDIYTPAVSVTQVQGSTDATKIATIGVGATSTDIYAPAKPEDYPVTFEITLTLTDDDRSAISSVTITDADKTPSEVYQAFAAGKNIIPTFYYSNFATNPEQNIMQNVFTAIQDQIESIFLTAVNFVLDSGIPTLETADGIMFFGVTGDITSEQASGWHPVNDYTGYRYLGVNPNV